MSEKYVIPFIAIVVVGLGTLFGSQKYQDELFGRGPSFQEITTGLSERSKAQEGTLYSHAIASTEVECLALNIYHEARNQRTIGQVAVGIVTLNRVASDQFPDTICDVVFEAKLNSLGDPIRNKCQFSWYCDGKSDAMNNVEAREYAYRIALALLDPDIPLGNVDITEGSLYYHASYVDPYWSSHFNRTVIIDEHIFYID